MVRPTVGLTVTVAILTVGGTYRFVMPIFVPQTAKPTIKMAAIASKELANVSNKSLKKMVQIHHENITK